jgi:hypothetical protein
MFSFFGVAFMVARVGNIVKVSIAAIVKVLKEVVAIIPSISIKGVACAALSCLYRQVSVILLTNTPAQRPPHLSRRQGRALQSVQSVDAKCARTSIEGWRNTDSVLCDAEGSAACFCLMNQQ